MIKPVFLATDLALFVLCLGLVMYCAYVRRTPLLAGQWLRVFVRPVGMVCSVILGCVLGICLLDSLHFRSPLPSIAGAAPAHSAQTYSVLDVLLKHLKSAQEKTYSRPFHSTQLTKETQLVAGQSLRDNPPLKFGGAHLRSPGQRAELWETHESSVLMDISAKTVHGALLGVAVAGSLILFWLAILLAAAGQGFQQTTAFLKEEKVPWTWGFVTLAVLCIVGGVVWQLSTTWHVLGTDLAGNDMVYLALKSLRSALVIGIFPVLIGLPFALVLGIAAGTLRGRVDTVVQYVYTVLNSIPGVLLIAACVLMIQGYIDQRPGSFPTALERADVKFLLLCAVLGLTSWAGLARLLRAEAMKLREMDFVLAARSFRVPHWQVMLRHIAPSTIYLVILTVVMEFSSLVLYEAVLSYIGIGVDPAVQSFGGMINGARSELARNPIVWWPLFAAFSFMLGLVMTANLFADCVRDAFDPKYAGRAA